MAPHAQLAEAGYDVDEMLMRRHGQSTIGSTAERVSSVRLYPDMKVEGQESYNAQLKREAEEKKAAHYKKLADRDQRKRDLPYLENQLKSLRARVEQDAIEEKAEQAAESNK